MMVTLFDEEKIMKAHDKTILEQGISQGVVEGIVKMCKRYNGTILEATYLSLWLWDFFLVSSDSIGCNNRIYVLSL